MSKDEDDTSSAPDELDFAQEVYESMDKMSHLIARAYESVNEVRISVTQSSGRQSAIAREVENAIRLLRSMDKMAVVLQKGACELLGDEFAEEEEEDEEEDSPDSDTEPRKASRRTESDRTSSAAPIA